MAFPPIAVRVAFESQPLASGSWVLGRSELGIDTRLGYYDAATWVDLAGQTLSGAIRRGRQHDLGRIEAGMLDVLFNNATGDLWPDYIGSAHFPNVVPAKRINIRVTYGGVAYDVYTGYVERWVPRYLSPGGMGPTVNVQASDFYKFLAQRLLNDAAGYIQELSGTRVDNLLDDLGVPEAQRDLDAGQTTVIATGALANENALEHLYLIQDTEQGIVFQAGDGDVTFHDRHARLTVPLKAARAMFGDGAALDIGPGATDRVTTEATLFTYIDAANPVAGDGVITSVSIWANVALTGCKVATFYSLGGNQFSTRASYTIGAVVAGSKQTFAIELPCETGDYLGIYADGGAIEADLVGGAGRWHLAGDYIPCYGTTFNWLANRAISIEGEGIISRTRDIELEMSDALIFNDVRTTREGGTEQVTSDGMSQQDYGYRTYQKSGLQMMTDGVALDMANWILQQHKDAHLRVLSLTIDPEADPDDLWPKVLGYDLGTKVWLKLSDADLDEAYFIEGIEHRFGPLQWQTKWWLSRATPQVYWILGESALGVETRLAY